MKLNTDLIWNNLSKRYHVKKYGIDIYELLLNPPTFYNVDCECRCGAFYICEADGLVIPSDAEKCLFLISGIPQEQWQGKNCSFLVLEETPSIQKIFNEMQDLFMKYAVWIEQLQTILDTSASIQKMTELTSVLLDEGIAICNRDLEISFSHNPHPENEIEFVHLTPSGMKMFLQSHEKNIVQKTPFVFRGECNAYCHNIYKNGEYLGVVTLPEIYHKLTDGSIQLFDVFYSYLYKAIGKLNLESPNGLANLKMIFKSILQGENQDEDIVQDICRENPGKWMCLASRLSDSMRKLPPEFICEKIESASSNLIALEQDGYIAILIPVQGEKSDRHLPKLLNEAIKSMLGSAGASIVFNNVLNARMYFKQAVVAQQTASTTGKTGTIYYFLDCAFDYIMDTSVGEFTPKYLMPKELLALKKKQKNVGEIDNWDILKCYLDNKMSTSVTARELYLHRSTLQHKIDQICETLDLTTPKNRLYLHYCMYLYDSHELWTNKS